MAQNKNKEHQKITSFFFAKCLFLHFRNAFETFSPIMPP